MVGWYSPDLLFSFQWLPLAPPPCITWSSHTKCTIGTGVIISRRTNVFWRARGKGLRTRCWEEEGHVPTSCKVVEWLFGILVATARSLRLCWWRWILGSGYHHSLGDEKAWAGSHVGVEFTFPRGTSFHTPMIEMCWFLLPTISSPKKSS